MPKTDRLLRRSRMPLLVLCLLPLFVASCTEGGGGFADNGGMSGTGISQGTISAFGSIFVNGVEWDLSGATIEIDGNPATEASLRVGMVVRVEGDFATSNATGAALRVDYREAVEGPIAAPPVESASGLERSFPVLGKTIVVHRDTTVFDGGATFTTLATDDVVEVSGFEDESGAIRATRITALGLFPAQSEVELQGIVANLFVDSDGSGLFDLGTVTVRFTSTTLFDDTTRDSLADGDRVEIEGSLRASGTEIDATRIEFEAAGLGAQDRDRVEIEGVVEICPESPDFCVGPVPVDASTASFDPIGFAPAPGDRVEVEGPLSGGVLRAERIESEDAAEVARNARIEAAATSIDPTGRTLVILGVTVAADGETRLEDNSAQDDENLEFGELQSGDFLEIRGIAEGNVVRALSIEREDAAVGSEDVRLEGPVTSLDAATSAIEVLGRPVPIDPGTIYFDALGALRTEEQFFRSPGDVQLGDVVRAEELAAAILSSLTETDEIEIEDPI